MKTGFSFSKIVCGIVFLLASRGSAMQPNFHEDLNATYDFSNHVKTISSETQFVNFFSTYPAKYDGVLELQGEDYNQGGSGGALDISALKIKSHTSNAINLKTSVEDSYGFVELAFPDNFNPVYPTDVVLLMEAFNYYDCTTLAPGYEDIIVELTLEDPFTKVKSTYTKNLPIMNHIRHFKTLQLSTCNTITSIPPQAFPLEASGPFMDLQTFRLSEEELKLEVREIKISVPRMRTIVPIPNGNPLIIYGGIRLHGVAITTDFDFGRAASGNEDHFDVNGPWFGQVHDPECTPWQWLLINPSNASTFQNIGCWISTWANLMYAQGVTQVEDETTPDLVPLTPFTLARYANKKQLFDEDNNGTGLPADKIQIILNKLKKIGTNNKLQYLDFGKDPATAPGFVDRYLARKIPVLLKIVGHKHFVVATGIKIKQYNGNWVRTYQINDVGYGDILDLADDITHPDNDYQNQFEYPLFAAPSDNSSPAGLVIKIYSPAYAFIVDPLGRMHGLNPDDNVEYNQIPFITSTIGDPSKTTLPELEEPPEPDPMKYIYISQPIEGTYVIKTVGTDAGQYTMDITSIDTAGVLYTQRLTGTTSLGQVDETTFEYTSQIQDTIPPQTVADYDDTGWNRINPLVIHFNSSDDISGVAQTYTSINGAPEQALNVVTLSEEGSFTINYRSVDNAGNVEEIRQLVVLNDFTPPVSSHDYIGDGHETGSVSINFQSTDQLSGLYTLYLLVNGDVPPSSILELNIPGDYEIVYYGVDNAGNTEAPETLFILVENVNHAPELDAINAQTVNEAAPLSFQVSGSDPDGDALSFTAANLPAGATFDTSTRTFNWTPAYEQAGSYTVTFTATDGNLTDTKEAVITVVNVNRPPVLADIVAQTVNEATSLSFQASGSDPDGDTLRFSVANLPAGATFDDLIKTFNWTPTYNMAGSYSVSFTVTDGLLSTSQTVSIMVVNVNVIPVVGNIILAPNPVDQGTEVSFSATFSDPGFSTESFTAACNWDDGSTTPVMVANNSVSGIHVYASAGVHNLTLTVTDNHGGSGINSLAVTVRNVFPTAQIDTVIQPNPLFIVTGQQLTFKGSFSDPGWLDSHVSTWDFGDGTSDTGTLTEENIYPDAIGSTKVNKTYTKPGTLTVVLTIRDNNGGQSTASRQVVIMGNLQTTQSIIVGDRSKVFSPYIFGGTYSELGSTGLLQTTTLSVAGNAFLRSRSKVDGNVEVSGFCQREDHSVVVTGYVNERAAVSVSPIPTRTVTFGTTDKVVNSDRQATWAPGNYRDCIVRVRGTLNLSTGTYNFRSLIFEPGSKVVMNNDSGPIYINVNGNLSFGDRTTQVINSDYKKVFYYTNYSGTISIGTNNQIMAGVFTAPNAVVTVYSGTTIKSVVRVKQLKLETDCTINCGL